VLNTVVRVKVYCLTSKTEGYVVLVQPWYAKYHGIMSEFSNEHGNFFHMLINREFDFRNRGHQTGFYRSSVYYLEFSRVLE
jgi:hypothetical protein